MRNAVWRACESCEKRVCCVCGAALMVCCSGEVVLVQMVCVPMDETLLSGRVG